VEIRKELKVLTGPAVKLCRKAKVKPDTVSIIGLWFAGLGCYFYAIGDAVTASIMVLLNGYFDLLDGDLARDLGRKDKKGEFLDNIIDRFADTFLFFGLFLGKYTIDWITVLAMATTLITSYLGGVSYRLFTGKKEYKGLGRGYRSSLIVLAGFFNMLHPAIIAVAAMNIYTILLRFFDIYKKA